MTLSATDEFWHSPIIAQDQDENMSSSSTHDSDSTTSDDDDHIIMSMPPSHHQLLHKHDDCSFENLNGYDHTQGVISYGDSLLDSYDDDDCCRQKLSTVKEQGGGSWLLGFARINDKATAATPQLEQEDMVLPGLVRVPSGSSLESDDSSSDGENSDDDSSLRSSASSTDSKSSKPRGVSFSPAVKVQPIPHSAALSPLQRRKMYSSSIEVRANKIRNKREYRYDGYDWRNITEEWEMGVDMVTGELVHPVHEHS
eukprot:CAMPEP_0172311284 /NCGR_PEP_ID=MMETSP1058-20130122/14508_1 /TAXON_ID=83371 /ORGANISM="Detonula confervacea, Strain CCMP 353" /LENGTH=254 /DNA_ID=CAMNT_0013024427 /DNA_START=195 /DNA_END=959 /DNA_ORIENTATION=+